MKAHIVADCVDCCMYEGEPFMNNCPHGHHCEEGHPEKDFFKTFPIPWQELWFDDER